MILNLQGMMREDGHSVSLTKLCKWFGISRSTFYYKSKPKKRTENAFNTKLEKEIKGIIEQFPRYGLRFIVAILRKTYLVNRKRIHRLIKKNNWQIRKTRKGHRPRVKVWRSLASKSNERWAIDTTHIMTREDGWIHMTAVIDCHDREIIGWRLSQSGKAKIAAAAMEEAFLNRRPGKTLTIRSDNGLVFGSKEFLKITKLHHREYITPYTPEQNGIIERFFRTLKEECIWTHQLKNKEEAFLKIAEWIDQYNRMRPHSALGYLSPIEYRAKISA